MRVESINHFFSQPLANVYLQNFSQVSHYFTYNPREQADFLRRHRYLLEQKSSTWQRLALHLKEYNVSLGCGSKTIDNIDQIEKGRAVAVVTGQQPGILTGPLYTIYKAIGAIKLAREFAQQMKAPVVPVFWIAADDHDFLEINHLFVPTSEGPKKITLNQNPNGRFSVGHLPIPQDLDSILRQLEELTPPIGWQQEAISLLKQTAKESDNLADWFGRLLTYLFKDQGLILLNPVLPQIRQLSASVFQKAIMMAPAVDQLLQRACLEINNAGFVPQIQSDPGKLHLFIYKNNQRAALYLKENHFTDRDGLEWSKPYLTELCQTNPELFSPDVVLRPMVQESILPVLSYVAGPGEISYYALLKNIYKLFGMSMPIIYPRPNICLVEPLVGKILHKYQVPLEVVQRGLEDFTNGFTEQLDTLGIGEVFEDFRSSLRKQQQNLVTKVASVDPELRGIGKENLRRMLRVVNSYEEKVRQRHRRNNEVALRQLHKVDQLLHPNGSLQERVYNVFPYIMKHQPQILTEIDKSIDLLDFRQKILFIN